jgi:LCP family protein required for cell wall assembly
MRKFWSILIDAVLTACILALVVAIAHVAVNNVLEAASLPTVTPVTFPAPAPMQTATSAPSPTPTRLPTRTRTVTPRPTASPRPTMTFTATPPPTLTPAPTQTPEFEMRGMVFPSVTPNGTVAINATPIPSPVPTIELPRGSVTIALLGSDKRPNRGDYRTDTIILANINPGPPAVTLLSIPRDLWVYIPGYQFQKINVADERGEFSRFPGGGAGLLKQTIEYNLGVHVDYYARVDFAGFIKIVDTLGGIDVLATCPLEDVFPDDPITEDPTITATLSIERPGLVHLDGKQALWYARSRETTSDWDRGLRQHRVLRAIWSKAVEGRWITRLPELWTAIAATVKTDLKLSDLLWLVSVGLRLDASNVQGHLLDGDLTYSWTTPDTHAWVLSPMQERLGPALQEMFNSPARVASEAVPVQVWNGTSDPARGLLAADRLQAEGYRVTSVTQADRTNYAHTQIVDMTANSQGSQRQALANLLRVAPANVVVQPNANSPAAYRVIVGADFDPCVRPRPSGSSLPTSTPTPAEPKP